jgi:hypothetical protein
MRGKYFFRYMIIVCFLVAATMGCKFIENIRSDVQLASTGVAVATDIGEIITQIPPGAGETAMAVIPTMQSAITEIAPTFEAITTQVYMSPSEAPPDIPIMPGETSAFVGSPQAISYVVKTDFNEVVNFYKTEMPNKGWTAVDTGEGSSSVAPGLSNTELRFEMGTRKATVVITEIPFVGQTTVVINIEGQ